MIQASFVPAMGLKFVLLVNKQGQTRLAKYSDQSMSVEERRVLEGEIVRKCLARAEKQVSTCTFAWARTDMSHLQQHPQLYSEIELFGNLFHSVPLLSTGTTKSSTDDMLPCSSWWALTMMRYMVLQAIVQTFRHCAIIFWSDCRNQAH